jgi:cytochrome c oxidase cbb3-type subunit 3
MADNTTRTTGHVWDDTLEEYNNPLPSWWIWGLYITIAWALAYWVIYPSWPIGKSFLFGANSVSYQNADGSAGDWHWNTRAKLLNETQAAQLAQKPYLDKLAAMPFEQIAKDPEMNSFVLSAGKPLFADNCAGCHQSGGQGLAGSYPNLTDDDWKFGGSYAKVSESITEGRTGYMPSFGEALNRNQIDALANYVISLSGVKTDAAKTAEGNKLYHSHTAGCYYCHGENAKGRQDHFGAPNLTDSIWQWANVPAQQDAAGKVAEVSKIITSGISKGVMPAWKARLSPAQIKLLTAYVHELGGGK